MTGRAGSFLYFFLGLMVGVFTISELAFKEKGEKQTDRRTSSFNLLRVPDTMSFAGEPVPVKRWEVNEAFDRELIYSYTDFGHISYILKLSSRYFPIIEERLRANGVPDDFKYLCVAESNLQNVVSKVGATGFWQFMHYTGPGFSLEINNNVDERYNVIKSTDAACEYLKQAYAKFGNWTAAAASYNCGQGGYSVQSAFQQTNYYYDLQLPDETNKYVYRILSFKYLMSRAKELGYIVDEQNGYPPLATRDVVVTSTIPNLVKWACDNKTNYKMLKLLNPWLRGRFLSVKPGKSYIIKLLVDNKEDYMKTGK